MPNHDAVIIVGKLDSDQLEKSISDLVGYVELGTKMMSESFDKFAKNAERSMSSLKGMKLDFGSAGNGGVKESARQANMAAESFDNLARAVQSASGRKEDQMFSTMNVELGILRERLTEARGQYSAFVQMAKQALQSGDKGMFLFANENVQKYGDEARSIIQQMRAVQQTMSQMRNVTASQGDSFKNFVQSLTRANPELAALNEQFRRGTSMLATQAQQQSGITEEIRRQAQAIRETESWKQKGSAKVGEHYYVYDPDRSKANNARSLEEQLLSIKRLQAEEEARISKENERQAQTQQQAAQSAQSAAVAYSEMAASQQRAAAAAQAQRNTTTPFQRYDDLRASIAAVLNVEQKQVVLTDTATGSYNKLSATLKQLTATYNALGAADRKSDQGKALVASIHEVQRAMQQIQSQAARPVNLRNVLGLDEKTLDDIAYKIRMLSNYRMGINLNTQSAEVSQVTRELERLEKRQREVMGTTREFTKENNALTRSLDYMKNRLAYMLTIGATTQFVKNLIDVRGQYELLERSIGTLVNTFEGGSRIFNELSELAVKSPFTLIELGGAAKQLSAYDFGLKEIVNTTSRLADMAAAVGVPLDRLTYALGQIRAYGHLNARDARMFANAGIPLVKQLADMYSELEGRIVSTSDVYSRISKKMVSEQDVISVINKMTDEGGKFFDFQAKQAETLKVQMANLNLAWNNMLNDLGKSNQGLITAPIKGIKVLLEHWREFDTIITQVAVTFGLYKAWQMAVNTVVGQSAGQLQRQIMAEKSAEAARLRSIATTRKLTIEELKRLSQTKQITAADYARIIAEKNLTAQQAYTLVAMNKNNKALQGGVILSRVLTAEQVKSAAAGGAWSAVLNRVGLSLKNAASAAKAFLAANWWMLAVGAIVDMSMYVSRTNDIAREMNENLRQGAEEASKSLEKFLTSATIVSARAEANAGKMTNEAAQKTWEAIRGEIEQSAVASDELIQKLLEEEDVVERVKKGFDVAESIKNATLALSELDEMALKVSQDSWLWGAFGEGLSSDIADLYNAMDELNKYEEKNKDKSVETAKHASLKNDLSVALKEANYEIDKFANDAIKTLYEVLGEEGVKDATKMAEAIARIYASVEAQEKNLRGDNKRYAEIATDVRLNKEFGDAYSKTTSAWKATLEKMRKDSASVFSDISDDIFDLSKPIDAAYVETFIKKSDELKSKLPADLRDVIDDMRKEAEENPILLRVRIAETFGVKELDALQKDFKKHFIEEGFGPKDALEARFLRLNKKEAEEYLEWEKRLQDELKATTEAIKANERVVSELDKVLTENQKINDARYQTAKNNISSLNETASAIREVMDWEKMREEKEKKTRKTEDPLGDAIAKEVQLIGEIQKRYKEYRKIGVDSQKAVEEATKEYGKTLAKTNATLKSFGITGLEGAQIATMDIKDIRDAYAKMLETANQLGNTKGIEALEKAIASLNVEITNVSYKKIVDGLNSELSKIKDEYELGVELSANPELGDMFGKLLGVDVESLPKDYEAALEKMQKATDEALGAGKFNIAENLSKAKFDAYVDEKKMRDTEGNYNEQAKMLNAIREWMYKIRVDEAKEQIKSWDSLLDKYAEYEQKKKKIAEEAKRERDLAVKKGASQDIIAAINRREQEQLAQLDFEEFKKSPEWITATGNLATLTDNALGMLIDSIEKYKREAKNLNPKQIKEINKALRELRKQQHEGNPFYAISDAILDAQSRFDDFQIAISEVEEEIGRLQEKQHDSVDLTDEESEKLTSLTEKWMKLKDEQKEFGRVNGKVVAEGIIQMIQLSQQAAKSFAEMFAALNGGDVSDDFKDVMNALDEGLQGAQLGASIGGGWGALIGGVAGTIVGWVKTRADVWNGTRALNNEIKASERNVKRLEIAYNNLEHAVNKAMGAEEIGLKREEIENKQKQLFELNRQMQLEEAKKKTDRDKVLDLQGQIADLKNEIADLQEEIVNDLLGADVKSAAEDFVDTWVEAWKAGETTLDAMEERMDEMIYNLIKKAAASKLVGSILQPFYDMVDEFTSESSEGGVGLTDNELRKLAEEAGRTAGDVNTALGEFFRNLESLDIISGIDKSSGELSALQQGISSITEETASALEGYMNGVSQQVYLQSDILTQIRDTLNTYNFDASLSVQSQLLFSMQQSVQTQNAIRSILDGWSNANGMAVRVEMV